MYCTSIHVYVQELYVHQYCRYSYPVTNRNVSLSIHMTCIYLPQGSDFCSTTGYDHLVKRLKEGKRTCHDFEEVIEKR